MCPYEHFSSKCFHNCYAFVLKIVVKLSGWFWPMWESMGKITHNPSALHIWPNNSVTTQQIRVILEIYFYGGIAKPYNSFPF